MSFIHAVSARVMIHPQDDRVPSVGVIFVVRRQYDSGGDIHRSAPKAGQAIAFELHQFDVLRLRGISLLARAAGGRLIVRWNNVREFQFNRLASMTDSGFFNVAVDIPRAPHDPMPVAARHVQLNDRTIRSGEGLVNVHERLDKILTVGEVLKRGQGKAVYAGIAPAQLNPAARLYAVDIERPERCCA